MKLPAQANTIFARLSLNELQRDVVIRAWSEAKCNLILAVVHGDLLGARRYAKTCRMLVEAFSEPVRPKCEHGLPLNEICRECDPTVCMEPRGGWKTPSNDERASVGALTRSQTLNSVPGEYSMPRENANPTVPLPSPFSVFSSDAPLAHPRFPRQCAQSAMAYRAACSDRMAAWLRYVIDSDPLLQPKADDHETMRHVKRLTTWRVLLRQAEIEAPRITADERLLMETLSRAYYAQLEREAVSDLADALADRAAEGESSGYMLGGIFTTGGR